MLRFSIRDVLWLMVVVGLGVGWYLQWTNSAARERDMQAEIKLLKAHNFNVEFWQRVLARQLDEERAKTKDNRPQPVTVPVGTTEPVALGSDPFAP